MCDATEVKQGCCFARLKIILHTVYFLIPKYSDIGPNVSAGKNANAATIAITAKTIKPKVEVSVFNVPALSGMYFFDGRIPAMATGPMIGRYRASNITIPHEIFQKGVLSPTDEPLP